MNALVRKLAIEMKSAIATGFTLDDIGIVVGEEVGNACGVGRGSAYGEGMVDEAFSALCDEVIAAIPFVKASRSSIELHMQAARDVAAEARAERIAFSSHW